MHHIQNTSRSFWYMYGVVRWCSTPKCTMCSLKALPLKSPPWLCENNFWWTVFGYESPVQVFPTYCVLPFRQLTGLCQPAAMVYDGKEILVTFGRWFKWFGQIHPHDLQSICGNWLSPSCACRIMSQFFKVDVSPHASCQVHLHPMGCKLHWLLPWLFCEK